jgi:hypothetical protein
MHIPTLRKSVVVFCLAAAIGMFMSSLCLFYYYHYSDRPNVPRPEVGRIYSSNSHGSVVYLTRSENYLLNILVFGGILPVLVGFLLNKRWRVFVDPLEGLSAEERYKVLHGPRADYKKVRETYKTKEQ